MSRRQNKRSRNRNNPYSHLETRKNEESQPKSKKDDFGMGINKSNPRHSQPSGRTPNQKAYIKAIQDSDIVICSGAAATGKTHIAVGMAAHALRTGAVDKIIVTRPVVSAGEELGFLPGDLEDKLDPYLRPIFDELENFASKSEIALWKNSECFEIAPIAYLRGRTFINAFVISDECQNMTVKQIKLLTTRFGAGSKMVLTGDVKQCDLHDQGHNGFTYACNKLGAIEGIAVIRLEAKDNQRHPLVEKMLNIYDEEVDNGDIPSTIVSESVTFNSTPYYGDDWT